MEVKQSTQKIRERTSDKAERSYRYEEKRNQSDFYRFRYDFRGYEQSVRILFARIPIINRNLFGS